MTGKQINVGIVGYGYAGRIIHAQLIKLVPRLNLYAVASRDEKKRTQAKSEYGVVTYDNYDDLLRDARVDLVVIATPHDSHAELAIKSMEAGKHCIVDKPMCITTKEADLMLKVREKTGVLLSVFHNRRWDCDFLTLQHVIHAGVLGKPFLIESSVVRYGKPASQWRCERNFMGSILHDWGVHLIDQGLQLMGCMPCSINCCTNFLIWGMSVESYVSVQMQFDDALYRIEVSYISHAPRPRWYVLGDKGGFIKFGLDPQEAALQRGDIGAAKEAPENRARLFTTLNGSKVEMTLESIPGRWVAFYENIAAALLDGAELAVKPEQSRQVIRLVELALSSAKQGKPIKVKET
ncbi:MAG: Gfo/Idh/MocA family oxidoreductase [Armatimonadota bacterium]|nr:Gfo/Idh/MocA family oxidoreductase [Armatimonadota bacterium]MCX7777396.1 Gfo/Idh/MocA family oxidoreductase [Armatimonadota bacterium]MDW8025065.1 Gfo/Idh/MocA family oxidoreductase [Armatimonadota bacterium]